MLTTVKAVLSALGSFFRWLGDKQLMDAGVAKRDAKMGQEQLDRVRRANSVRIDGVRDPFDRAGRG